MPRIRGASIEQHHEMVWADLAEAMRHLLLERDYDSITMGHIAARAGLARNTLYNYAGDKSALVRALTQRAGRPAVERVAAIAARSPDPAAGPAAGDHRGGPGSVHRPGAAADVPARLRLGRSPRCRRGRTARSTRSWSRWRTWSGTASPAASSATSSDVPLAVELLSGVMRSGAERIGRDPASFAATVREAREIILSSLAR